MESRLRPHGARTSAPAASNRSEGDLVRASFAPSCAVVADASSQATPLGAARDGQAVKELQHEEGLGGVGGQAFTPLEKCHG
jgi:hypothetical protein